MPQLELPFENAAACAAKDVPPPAGEALLLRLREAHPRHIDERRAAELFARAARARGAASVRRVRATFRPFRSTLYSFRIDPAGTALIRFHLAFRAASDEVFLQAAHLMLARTRRARVNVERGAYDAFVAQLPHAVFNLPGTRRYSPRARTGPGRFRSLEESFARVNARYFEGRLARPRLCWSPGRSRRVLGSYDPESDRLIVSRLFDSPRVPLFVLDYLMYHELLHKHLGIGRRPDGKRCMHGPEFRRLERRYEKFREAVAFIERRAN
ncbi:MAG: hypothetical protein M5U26_02355 [Planctomycetota bacterium]|nr:hypothetical protein [Planctomycetota bacterium]